MCGKSVTHTSRKSTVGCTWQFAESQLRRASWVEQTGNGETGTHYHVTLEVGEDGEGSLAGRDGAGEGCGRGARGGQLEVEGDDGEAGTQTHAARRCENECASHAPRVGRLLARIDERVSSAHGSSFACSHSQILSQPSNGQV